MTTTPSPTPAPCGDVFVPLHDQPREADARIHALVCERPSGHQGPHHGRCAGCLAQIRDGSRDPSIPPVDADWARS